MSKKVKEIFSYVAVIIGALMASFSVACILLPNDAIDYGTAGIAIIISKLTGCNLSLCILLFYSVPHRRICLPRKIFFYKGIHRICRIHRRHCLLWGNTVWLNTEHFIAVAFGGALLGIGLSFILRNGGCIDGSEIIANIIVNKIHQKTGKDYSISYILIIFNALYT